VRVEIKGRHMNKTYASSDDYDSHLQSSIIDGGCKRKLIPFKEVLSIKIESMDLRTLHRNAYADVNRLKSL